MNVILPEINDFMTVFGYECTVDEDLKYTCELYDKNKNCLKIRFSEIDRSFDLALKLKAGNEINIYNEFLSNIRINPQKQSLCIEMDNGIFYEILNIEVWPIFNIKLVCMNTT